MKIKHDNIVSVLVVALVAVGIIAYSVGVSAGKTATPTQDHTDSEYVAAKACFDYLSTQMDHINTITTYLGGEPTYEALATAINQISSYDAGIAVLPPSNGGYTCP